MTFNEFISVLQCARNILDRSDSPTAKEVATKLGESSMFLLEIEQKIVKLEQDRDFLDALRAAGVDNWEGYDFAMEMLDQMKG